MKIYSYVNFAQDAIVMANGGEISVDVEEFIDKAEKLMKKSEKANQTRSSHAKTHKTRKAPNQKTMENVSLLMPILDETPKTVAEINTILDTTLTPAQVRAAMKYIEGGKTTKVTRIVFNGSENEVKRAYSAYYISHDEDDVDNENDDVEFED